MSCDDLKMQSTVNADLLSDTSFNNELVIKTKHLCKKYFMYDKPIDRLKQAFFGGKRKFYREFWALSDISLEIRRGETIGIIGKNGSGKSTLLQLICNTLQPTTGSAITKGRVAALLELGSGFNPEFSGIDNIYMNATLLGLRTSEIEKQLDNILAFADIGEFVNQPVRTYSSGMQVRLAFSVIAHVDADILICDEALAVGDSMFTQKCMRFIKKFQERGTLLFVSHDVGSVAAITERSLWLNKGKLMFDGKTRSCLKHYSDFCQEESGFRIKTKQLIEKNSIKTDENETSYSRIPKQTGDNATLTNGRTSDFNDSIPTLLANDWEHTINMIANKIMPIVGQSVRSSHCDGVAMILGYKVVDEINGETVSPIGGNIVSIVICCKSLEPLSSPFVGFQVLNRRGQVMFGTNTYKEDQIKPLDIDSDVKFYAVFRIDWPLLSPGEYAINLAVSTGNYYSHVNHHWINEAIIIRSMETPRNVSGLFAPHILNNQLVELH